MPSAHSASLAYTATAWTILLVRDNAELSQSLSRQTSVLLGLHSCALIVAYSRAFLGHHTPRQVVVGYIGGTIFALCWMIASSYVIGPVSYTIEDDTLKASTPVDSLG
jgi:membrane-associated phospholipid phosphatase